MLSILLLSTAISAATRFMPRSSAPMPPQKQEMMQPVYATLPRRKERLSRFERRHPKLNQKEKRAFKRLVNSTLR